MPETSVGLEGTASPESDRYRLLLEVTDRVARTQSLPEALRELAPPVLALTGGELLNLSLYDPRRDCMLTQYWKKNRESGEFDALPVDEVATGWAWKHQKPIAIHDTEREQRFPGFVPLAGLQVFGRDPQAVLDEMIAAGVAREKRIFAGIRKGLEQAERGEGKPEGAKEEPPPEPPDMPPTDAAAIPVPRPEGD